METNVVAQSALPQSASCYYVLRQTNMDATSSAGKKPLRFKWVFWIAITVALYTLAGFFLLPAIIKSQMLKRLPGLTKRQPAVGQVKFNPYAFSLTVREFSLKESNGDVFSSFDELYVRFRPLASLFKRGWDFREITLRKPFAQIVYQKDGNFNFANLLIPTPKGPRASQPLPFVFVNRIVITNGGIGFADRARPTPFQTRFFPIDLDLTNLTTMRDGNSPYAFSARTDLGESFAWSGTVSVNPLRSQGSFQVGGLNLKNYSSYSRDYATFEIVNGVLAVAADYRYDSLTNALDLEISKAGIQLDHLELKAPDTGETVIAIPALSVTQVEAALARKTTRVGSIKSSGGALILRQNRDGSINLLSLLKLPKTVSAASQPPPAERAPAWVVKIDEIAFDNYVVSAEDRKPAKPANFKIAQLSFQLKGVSNAGNAPVTVSLSSRLQETGALALEGTATLLPPSAALKIALTNLDLRAFQPYVEEQVKLVINRGALNLNGNARYTLAPAAPRLTFRGDLTLAQFATADDVLFKDFAKWDALSVTGVQLDLQPDKLRLEEVKFTGLDTSLIIGPDHRANLQTILRNQLAVTNQPAPPGAPPVKPANPDVALEKLVFANAAIHFADQSIEPHCAFDVRDFGGTIQHLSLQSKSPATVDVKGNVDERSPFGVSGRIDPSPGSLFADLAVAFTNTDLTAFTPYCEKFAGRPLAKGKLSFGVHYLVEHNALKAENGFYLDQLTLGAKNNSPDATSLPVKLAIALLKDRNGRIQLDIPVQGRLDDPKFRLAPIIWQVVVNLITKAATAPFALLGAAFGGGQEMSFVAFDPGQVVVPESEVKKLDTLSKALYERPTLNLEISGAVDPAAERAPLARAKLEEQIKSLWIKEQTDAGNPAPPLDQIKLDPPEYQRLVKKACEDAFGPFQPKAPATNSTPPPVAIAPPPVVAHPAPAHTGSSAAWRRSFAKALGTPAGGRQT